MNSVVLLVIAGVAITIGIGVNCFLVIYFYSKKRKLISQLELKKPSKIIFKYNSLPASSQIYQLVDHSKANFLRKFYKIRMLMNQNQQYRKTHNQQVIFRNYQVFNNFQTQIGQVKKRLDPVFVSKWNKLEEFDRLDFVNNTFDVSKDFQASQILTKPRNLINIPLPNPIGNFYQQVANRAIKNEKMILKNFQSNTQNLTLSQKLSEYMTKKTLDELLQAKLKKAVKIHNLTALQTNFTNEVTQTKTELKKLVRGKCYDG